MGALLSNRMFLSLLIWKEHAEEQYERITTLLASLCWIFDAFKIIKLFLVASNMSILV